MPTARGWTHELLDMGVDSIITERHDVLRDVLVSRGEWTTMSPQRAVVERA